MKRSPQLGTTRDASPILGCSDGTTRWLARRGVLPTAYTLPSGTRLFDLEVVERVRVARDRQRRRRRQAATAIGDRADEGAA